MIMEMQFTNTQLMMDHGAGISIKKMENQNHISISSIQHNIQTNKIQNSKPNFSKNMTKYDMSLI